MHDPIGLGITIACGFIIAVLALGALLTLLTKPRRRR